MRLIAPLVLVFLAAGGGCRDGAETEDVERPFAAKDLAEPEAWLGCADERDAEACGGEACARFLDDYAVVEKEAEELLAACPRIQDPLIREGGSPGLVACARRACRTLAHHLPERALTRLGEKDSSWFMQPEFARVWVSSEDQSVQVLDRVARDVVRDNGEVGYRVAERVVSGLHRHLDLSSHDWIEEPTPRAWPRASRATRDLLDEMTTDPPLRSDLLEIAAFFDWEATVPLLIDELAASDSAISLGQPELRVLRGVETHDPGEDLRQRIVDEICVLPSVAVAAVCRHVQPRDR